MRNITTILNAAVKSYIDRFGFYMSIVALPIIISAIPSLMFKPGMVEPTSPVGWVLFGCIFIISMILQMYAYIALILSVDDHNKTLKEVYREAHRKIWSYIGLTIVLSLVILGGLILLIVPAIIFMVWFAFSQYVLILERKPIIASLKYSKKLVKGHFMKVFGRLAFITLLALIVWMPFGLIPQTPVNNVWHQFAQTMYALLLVVPITVYVYSVYKDLKKLKERESDHSA